MIDARALLEDSFRAAVAAADPAVILPAHLPAPPARGRTIVVGAGKAGGSMARAFETNWPADAPLAGLVLTRYGHAVPTKRIELVEAAHPVPDAAGEAAAARILALVESATRDDRVIVLVSGGGSALLSLPARGLTMADLRATTDGLLRSGAPIQDMNTVRKHLSAISGGRLALASKAPVLALIISDVTGDDPTHIASGPCAADPTTYRDAQEIIARYGIDVPAAIAAHLERGAAGEIPETPKPGDPALAHVEQRVIATAQRSLEAGAAVFERAGIPAVVLSDSITGEAREVGKVHAAIAQQIARYGSPWKRPVALVSGGECTVTITSRGGRGGRCSEFLLGLAIALEGAAGIHALAADTDGIDGSEANAGAYLAPDSIARAAAKGVKATAALAANDAYAFFAAADGLVTSGPTLTNVNDYRVVLIR